jgi:hypothetical protein
MYRSCRLGGRPLGSLAGGPSFFMPRPTINVYVDGFNLYYGCLRNTPYKWLDIAKLCRFLLPEYRVNRLRYFTARITARPADPVSRSARTPTSELSAPVPI